MEIKYVFRFSDYQSLCHAARSDRYWLLVKTAILIAFLVNLFFALYIFWLGRNIENDYNWIPNALIAIFLAIYYFWLRPWLQRYQLRSFDIEGKTMKVSLFDDEVIASQNDMQSRISWSNFVRFSKSGSRAFLWINKAQAIVVPYDAFSDSEYKDRFLGFIESKLSSNERST
jgi:hypothetical protein